MIVVQVSRREILHVVGSIAGWHFVGGEVRLRLAARPFGGRDDDCDEPRDCSLPQLRMGVGPNTSKMAIEARGVSKDDAGPNGSPRLSHFEPSDRVVETPVRGCPPSRALA